MLISDAEHLIQSYVDPLTDGLLFTGRVFIGGLVVATIVGLIVGTLRLSRYRVIRYPAIAFVEIFRGTSAIVQLFWVFYALPLLFGVTLPALLAAWTVIGFNQGAYLAEVVRSAIQSVPVGQIEASVAINLNARARWRRVVLPQALPIILPPYTNHAITVLKETAIVSLIGITDLTYSADILRTEHGNTTALFVSVAMMYLLLALALSRCGRILERRFSIYRTAKDIPPGTGTSWVPAEQAGRGKAR